MRRLTKANIRVLSKDNLPKIAFEDDEMVQVRALSKLHGLLFPDFFVKSKVVHVL